MLVCADEFSCNVSLGHMIFSSLECGLAYACEIPIDLLVEKCGPTTRSHYRSAGTSDLKCQKVHQLRVPTSLTNYPHICIHTHMHTHTHIHIHIYVYTHVSNDICPWEIYQKCGYQLIPSHSCYIQWQIYTQTYTHILSTHSNTYAYAWVYVSLQEESYDKV